MLSVVQSDEAPAFRGQVLTFWESRAHEIILAGPYETGKTYATLSKLHLLLCLFPKARALMVRKTRKSILNSAVVTYEQKVLPFPIGNTKCTIQKYGGELSEFYLYPNKSRLIVGGLDDADKYLSAEYDFIYVNQAEEIALDAWEKLVGRATGRAGNAPFTQVMGDCNPGPPNHWIRSRAALTVLETRHEDNPALYDGVQWTAQGKRTIAILDSLTGLRYKRGRLGLWVGAEGVVYEFDSTVHLLNLATLATLGMVQAGPVLKLNSDGARRVFVAVDWGFTNPGVMQVWAADGDGRMYMVYEIYQTGKTIDWWKARAEEISERFNPECFVCDPSEPAYILQLRSIGVHVIGANNEIRLGIEKVQERLRVQADGRARLFLYDGALAEVDTSLRATFKPTSTADEFGVYAYPEGKDGRPVKEEPVKVYDHAMDALRYAVMYMDAQMGWSRG